MRRTLIALVVALLLSACGLGHTEGWVTDRKMVPAHTETRQRPVYQYTCMPDPMNAGQLKCENRLSHFEDYIHAVPDKWYITVVNNEGQSKTIEVSKERYNSLSIDEYYNSADE